MIDNLNAYRIFFYAVKCGSISRASEELYITQPAITRTIQSLESSLGCQLLLRSSKGVTPTSDGQTIYKSLITAFESINTAETSIRQNKRTVHVGVNCLTAHAVIMQFAKHIEELFNNTEVRIDRINSSYELLTTLINGGFDMVFAINADSEQDIAVDLLEKKVYNSNVCYTYYGDFPEVFLVGTKYSYLSERPVTLEELLSLPFIFHQEDPHYSYYFPLIRPDGVFHESDLPTKGATNLISLTANNFGFCYYPSQFVQQELEQGSLFKVNCDVPMKSVKVYSLLNSSVPMNSVLRSLLELLRNHLSSKLYI